MAIPESFITGLISDQANRATNMTSNAVSALNSLGGLSYPTPTVVSPPNFTGIQWKDFVPPTNDTSAMPVYVPPTTTLPGAPTLADVSPITKPVFPTTPTIDISKLFKQVAPSTNI
jgi:hypothetical protein